jgi:hypothetical protein
MDIEEEGDGEVSFTSCTHSAVHTLCVMHILLCILSL